MSFIAHLNIEEAPEVFKRLSTFNRSDEKFRLVLEGSRGVFLNPKGYTFVNFN